MNKHTIQYVHTAGLSPGTSEMYTECAVGCQATDSCPDAPALAGVAQLFGVFKHAGSE